MSLHYLNKSNKSDMRRMGHQSRTPSRLSSLRLKAAQITEATNSGSDNVDKPEFQTSLRELKKSYGEPRTGKEEEQQHSLARIMIGIFVGALNEGIKELADQGKAVVAYQKKHRKPRKRKQRESDQEWVEKKLNSTKYLLEMVQKKRELLAGGSDKDMRNGGGLRKGNVE